MSVKMPKPVSKTELSRLYTRLAIDTHHRLDNSTAEGQARLGLLHRFLDACANLYGTMTLWHAWELFQHVEPELTAKKKILRKDFFSFAEIVRVEKHAYAIMLLPDLYEEETSISIQDAELVHRMLIYPNIWGLNEYYKLLSYQGDKPCVVPAHDVFYAYADPNYFWETPEARSLRFFLANLHVAPNAKTTAPDGTPLRGKALSEVVFWTRDDHWEYDDYKAAWRKKAVSEEANKPYLQRIMEKIQRGILLSFVCDQFSYYVELLEEAGVQFTKPQFETFANRLCELNNHSHLWSNRGGQPVEMYDGLDNAELDAAALMKTMQLDPDGYYRNPVLSRITPKKNEDGQD